MRRRWLPIVSSILSASISTSLVRPYSNYSACYRHRNVFAATTILQEIDNRHDTAREREHGWQWVDKVNLHNEFCDTHSLTLLLIWWLTVVVHLPLPACLSQLMQYKFITNSRYWFTVGVWVQVNGTSLAVVFLLIHDVVHIIDGVWGQPSWRGRD